MTRGVITAFIGLGANLGHAAQTIRDAVQAVGRLPATHVVRCSSLYQTAPHEAAGPDYINAVIEISTRLTAPDLLTALLQLERSAGRERPYPNAPRTLDLDLLLYGNAQISSAQLTVPHPRLGDRAFVLVPLAEIAPGKVSAAQLQSVRDQAISKIQEF